MNKKINLTLVLLASFQLLFAQSNELRIPSIKTIWGENLDENQPHSEYPRPQMTRSGKWQNLNGKWKYTLTDVKQSEIPSIWDGDIVVPFAIESTLSGVGKSVGKDKVLWYRTTFKLDSKLKSDRLLLHFGAVDWQCDVFVNGKSVGRHEGGFDAFSFDITAYLKKGDVQDIAVRVWDPTDEGPQPRGKQVNKPHGIWYTPVTGIWQTVWLEGTPKTFIASTKQTPKFDDRTLELEANVVDFKPGDVLKIRALDGNKVLQEKSGAANTSVVLPLPNTVAWTPANPKLYDLDIELLRNGKVIDRVKSYFAMRKISMAKDKDGIQRMMLNNEFTFQYGPLDQGWWPESLHTAPSDEALKYDILKTKEMGFNMIRKHIKVEPARWYRYCDSIGMLVWQDMPSGDLGGNAWDMQPGKISGVNLDKVRTAESEAMYRKEWKAIMEQLHNFPSIVVWVPFNEAWGQFKTKEITEWTMQKDGSRLVNSASGGNFMDAGHILDIHNYPDAAMPDPAIYGAKQTLALGEFGGLGLPVEGHTWQNKDNWGYQSFKNKEDLLKRYSTILSNVKNLISLGLSAAVYTQTTDVEIETNGLMTYDRKIMKMPIEEIRKINEQLYRVPVKF